MATLVTTPIKTFISGETVTPAKLNELGQSTVTLTAGTIVDADISAGAAIAAGKLAGTLDLSSKTVTLPAAIALPAGAVMPFAMNSAPSGWLAADGTAVSRSTYAALFAAVGTTHGAGDGSTTFNLPDLRGIFVRGSGSQTISGTTYNKTFAAKERDAFQGHIHSQQPSAGLGGTGFNNGGGAIAYNGTATGGPLSDGANGTPRTASETRPANIALLYCIKH